MALPTHCNCENAVTCNCSNFGGTCFGGNAQKVVSPGIDNIPGDVEVICQNAVVCQPVVQDRYELSGGAIAGIAIGALLLLGVIVLVLIIILKGRGGALKTAGSAGTPNITYDS